MSMAILPKDFKLERYFAQYEFTTQYLLGCSDAEALSMKDVINMADSECKSLWGNLSLSYTESAGHPLLRKEVASLHDVHPEDVLTITPQEGIYIAMHCLVNHIARSSHQKHPHVIATFPAYQSLHENLTTLRCDVTHWHVRETSSGWAFDMHELETLVRDDTRLLVVNFPHNPTGYAPSEQQWQYLIQFCRSRDMFLFSDEMYRWSNHDGSAPLTSACAVYDKAITLSGLSKTFALPGLRIGWLCTRHHDVMLAMQSFKDYITICGPAPSEILAIIALRNKDAIVERTLAIIRRNLTVLRGFADNHSDVVEWHPPSACTTGLMRLKGWVLGMGEGPGASGFCSWLVENAGVLLVPATMYDMTHEPLVRVGFGRNNMPKAIGALSDFLDKHKPQQ